ncbi:hypothetical protein Ddc_15177 [Ditylenchus destructor]|nr:hypothetical protein Ddc_15177 [Ditylenchus destructor]
MIMILTGGKETAGPQRAAVSSKGTREQKKTKEEEEVSLSKLGTWKAESKMIDERTECAGIRENRGIVTKVADKACHMRSAHVIRDFI